MKELLEYFKGDELAATTWKNKYAWKEAGEKTPADMHMRMAREFARIEDKYDIKDTPEMFRQDLSEYGQSRKKLTEQDIYQLFENFKYIIPGGSIMASLGTNSITSLSNCFVIGSPEDSYTSIMEARTQQAHLMKRRGGVGYDLSNLRPKGSKVNNAAGTATGPASFMEVNSAITKEVAQDGRRGALMLTMDIRHPDSPDFINMKQDLTKVTGANISLKVRDDFMQAVEKDEDYLLRWPVDKEFTTDSPESFEYDVLTPVHHVDGTTSQVKRVKAKKLWEQLIHAAWNTAEPGILFIDRIHDYSPDGTYEEAKAISTNPCGEIPLGPYDSCRLMHLNLTSFIHNPYTEDVYMDAEELYRVAYEAIVLGDDLVDLEIEAIDRILNKVSNDKDFVEEKLWVDIRGTAFRYRRIGVGFTGLADARAMLGLKYGSGEDVDVTEMMMYIIFNAQLDATTDLAVTRGMFPGKEEEEDNAWTDFVKESFPVIYKRMAAFGRRNLSFSTVAPTGTVSIMSQTSSGIEPVFMPYYMRRRRVSSPDDRVDFTDQNGEKFTEFAVLHPQFIRWCQTKNYSNTKQFLETLTPKELGVLFQASPWYGSTAPEISYTDRIETQSMVQRFITHAISSTVNLPENTTESTVADLYMQAWKKGLKGITIYRDNCRQGILNAIKQAEEVLEEGRQAHKRPKVLEADYYQVKSKGKQYIVLVGLLHGKPYEIFTFEPLKPVNIEQHKGVITKVKKGHYSFDSEHINVSDLQLSTSNIEEKACTLYTSMLLRHSADIKFIIKTARKINDNITSFSSAMCRVLSKYVDKEMVNGESCPECGGRLIREASCDKCLDCGYSKCL